MMNTTANGRQEHQNRQFKYIIIAMLRLMSKLKYTIIVSPLLVSFFFIRTAGAIDDVNINTPAIHNQISEVTLDKTPEKALRAKESFFSSADLWGLATAYRIAEVPYESSEESVSDFIPVLIYEKDRFYWHGTEVGYKVSQYDNWNISLFGQYRFFDIPAEFQSDERGNAYDIGLRYQANITTDLDIDLELLNDTSGRNHINLTTSYHWQRGNWYLNPSITLRYKNTKYNNFYYGLGIDSPGSDIDIVLGSQIRYKLFNDIYLFGQVSLTQFGSDTYQSSVIDTPNQSDILLGIGYLEDNRKKKTRYLKAKPYIRLAHGSATPSNLGEIVILNKDSDRFNNKMDSFFLGIPISDTLFNKDIPVYFTAGVVRHRESVVQANIPEYVMALKGYYTFSGPVKIRLGIAEGLSYASRVTYIEQTELEAKGFRTSRLLNFIDLSLDIELSDIFNNRHLKNIWLGYSIHHRSGIFETSSAFGRIRGGSNYTTFYLQYHW